MHIEWRYLANSEQHTLMLMKYYVRMMASLYNRANKVSRQGKY